MVGTEFLSGQESAQHNSGGGRNIVTADKNVFFAAVQMTRMPMIITDPHLRDNPIIFANQAFEFLSGYNQQEVMGRNCRFLQGPETDRDAVARVRAGIHAHRDVHEKLYNYRKDGTGFWNALFISPVFDPSGALLYFFASQIDVTHRQEAEAVLQQAMRLETLGAMASGVAHEFNNLMTVALGSLQRLERLIPNSDLGKSKLDQIRWAIQQASRLTQQMLSFARREYHGQQSVALNRVVSGFDGILQQVAGDAVMLHLELTEDDPVIQIDAGQMEMALLNLVRNAADAMPDGGDVFIRTRIGDDRQSVELAVTDAGTGMPPAVIARATDPFFTTKPVGSGTGLGLSMVNGFAAENHGTLAIRSEIGQGTTVTLRFPLSD